MNDERAREAAWKFIGAELGDLPVDEFHHAGSVHRDTLVRVLCDQCGTHQSSGGVIGRVYDTPSGPLYVGTDTGDGDHEITGAEMKQFRERIRPTIENLGGGDYRQTGAVPPPLVYGMPAKIAAPRGRRSAPPLGLRIVLDFPLRTSIEHERAAGWCSDHLRVFFDWDDVVRELVESFAELPRRLLPVHRTSVAGLSAGARSHAPSVTQGCGRAGQAPSFGPRFRSRGPRPRSGAGLA